MSNVLCASSSAAALEIATTDGTDGAGDVDRCRRSPSCTKRLEPFEVSLVLRSVATSLGAELALRVAASAVGGDRTASLCAVTWSTTLSDSWVGDLAIEGRGGSFTRNESSGSTGVCVELGLGT